MKRLIIGVILVLSNVAYAQQAQPPVRLSYCGSSGGPPCSSYNVISNVAADAAEASRTINKVVDGYAKLIMVVKHTYNAGTAVTITCSGSIDNGATYGSVTSRSISAGAGTLSAFVDTYTTGTTKTFAVIHDVLNYTNYKCIYAVASGNSNDKLDVQWRASVGY